jgi:cholesterol oxidase
MSADQGKAPASYDAVVVGSGFGGSISALRLAEAGRSVLVLERGKRYPLGSFPRDVRDVDSLFWRPKKRKSAQGLYELRMFSGIGAVVAAGVGGGSLIYANIHIRPDRRVFDDPRWPSSYTRDSLDPYYERVARTLDVAPLPDSIRSPKRDAFRAAARALSREVFEPDEAVFWNRAPGGGRSACKMCAECEFGCQFGAKNTLDYTYLARAEKLGAELTTHANVTHVEPGPSGYRVHYRDLQSGEVRSVDGRRVVLSAGTLGSNEILLRCRDVVRSLPKLSQRLGHGYSGNGDFLGSIQNSKTEIEPWYGPDVTSVMRFFDELPGFTMAAPTFNRGVMDVLSSLGQPRPEWLRPGARLLWPALEQLLPWLFEKGLLSQPMKHKGPHAGEPARMTNLFAIGQDNANGQLRLKCDELDIEWDYARENVALITRMTKAMQDTASSYGGTFAPLATWEAFKRTLTVHSLGGCHLADDPARGVVSEQGEVFNYPGLFVADGSLVPTAIGFHPVMTISAIAERVAEHIAGSFV